MTNIIYPRQFHCRVTSASKPSAEISIEQNAINVMWSERLAIRDITNERLDTVCARVKKDILLNLGWSVYERIGFTVYIHPGIADNRGFYLDDAWQAQLSKELGGRSSC